MICAVQICIIGQVELTVAANAGIRAVCVLAGGNLLLLPCAVCGQLAAQCISTVFALLCPEQKQLTLIFAEARIVDGLGFVNRLNFAPFAVTAPADADAPAAIDRLAPRAADGAAKCNRRWQS